MLFAAIIVRRVGFPMRTRIDGGERPLMAMPHGPFALHAARGWHSICGKRTNTRGDYPVLSGPL